MSNFETVKIGRYINILSGFAFDSEYFSDENQGMPLIRIRDLENKNTEAWFTGKFDAKYLVSEGNILVGMDGDFLVAKWKGNEALLNQRVCKLETANQDLLLQDFLYYSIIDEIKKINQITSATTVKHLSTKNIQNLEIKLPKQIKVQEKIAEVLSTIDRAITQTEALIAKHQRIKTGLMQDLLTRGIDEHGQLRDQSTHRFKSTPLGMIPVEWDAAEIQTKLSSIIDYRGKTPRKTDSGTWLITARNVRDGYLSPEPKEFIATETYDDWMTRGIPSPGDVLFTTEAPMGNVARIPHDKIAVGQRILTLVANPTVLDSDFLFWLLQWESTKERLKLMTTGSTVTGIKQAVFRKVIMQFPKTDEQKMIANILNSANGKIESIQTQLSKLYHLKTGLMQDLLSGEVSVTPLMEG